MHRQRLIIGVSGSSAPHLAWATLKALHNHAEVETHLVVSRGADKTIELEMGAKRDDFEALADVSYDPGDFGAAISSGSFLTMGMAVGAALAMLAGALGLRSVANAPPLQTLRESAQ